jgi:hypothetical protein
MDNPTFDPDHYPAGEWTPWTQTGVEGWRMIGQMAGARIRVDVFAATGYSLKTEFRWEIARLAGDATLLRSGSTNTLAKAMDELHDALWLPGRIVMIINVRSH